MFYKNFEAKICSRQQNASVSFSAGNIKDTLFYIRVTTVVLDFFNHPAEDVPEMKKDVQNMSSAANLIKLTLSLPAENATVAVFRLLQFFA